MVGVKLESCKIGFLWVTSSSLVKTLNLLKVVSLTTMHRVTDGRADRPTDDIIMPIAASTIG